MAKKPANLIYGVDDNPPLMTATLLGIQDVFVMTAGSVMVTVITTTIGADQEQITNVLRMSMIASGIATPPLRRSTQIGGDRWSLPNSAAFRSLGRALAKALASWSISASELETKIEDDGRPFNPLESLESDLDLPLEQRSIDGLGIHLVRKLMSSLE